MTVATAIALLIGVGYAQPQAETISRFMWRATHTDRHYSTSSILDPCANSRLGEGLVDVTGTLRGELHRYSRGWPMQAVAGSRKGCIPAEVQIAYLRWAFPLHYPNCSTRFEQGDLPAFQRCWGEGRSR